MGKDSKELISLKYDEVYREVFGREGVRRQFLGDVLEIPVESIKRAELVRPQLWKRYRSQKLGILDIALVMNDDARINVELQIKKQKHWIKRQLFYHAKMYEEDLKAGQDYGRLKRCISIGILDFRLLEGEEYHSVYRLRDVNGAELTDLWEIHVIELGKRLRGDRLDDWIRLFNAEKVEELDMLAARNQGLGEAVEVIKRMSLVKALRCRYEAHQKAVRDRYGEDEYVRDQGKAEGRVEGKVEDVLQLLGELGEIPDALGKRIRQETDLQVLGRWLKASARAGSIPEFEAAINGQTAADNSIQQ